MKIKHITNFNLETTNRILEVWESSVRATHEFLEEEDIDMLRNVVEKALPEIDYFICAEDEDGIMQAFAGINEKKLEMLFVTPDMRGRGLGQKLTDYAIKKFNVKLVDVNEQNTQAVGFYEYMGFTVFERSETDNQGNPFPILHMQLQ